MSVDGKRDDAGNARRVLRMPDGTGFEIQVPQRGQHRPLVLQGDEDAVRSWMEEREKELPRLREILLRWKLDLQLPQPKEEEAPDEAQSARRRAELLSEGEAAAESEAAVERRGRCRERDACRDAADCFRERCCFRRDWGEQRTTRTSTEGESAPETAEDDTRLLRSRARESGTDETPAAQEASAAGDSNDENKPKA